MYNLGQTVKIKLDNAVGIFLGSEEAASSKDLLMYVYRESGDDYDTDILSTSDIEPILEPDTTSITGTKIYKGKCAKQTMAGGFTEKECVELKDKFVKEVKNATKKFITPKK